MSRTRLPFCPACGLGVSRSLSFRHDHGRRRPGCGTRPADRRASTPRGNLRLAACLTVGPATFAASGCRVLGSGPGRSQGSTLMRRLLVVLSPLTLAVLFAFPATPALAGMGQHAAITITSNADFSTCGCVTGGDGTAANPFIIGPWSIGAPSSGTSGWSVKIDNSGGKITDYFNTFGISSTYNDTNPT